MIKINKTTNEFLHFYPGEFYNVSKNNNSDLWARGRNLIIHKWNGTAWQAIPGKFKNLSVSPKNIVYGIGLNNIIHIWSKGPSLEAATEAGNFFTDIQATNNYLYTLTTSNTIFCLKK